VVREIIFGPTVYVYDECVAVCVGILRDKGIEPTQAPAPI
jgi:hypothetical protein